MHISLHLETGIDTLKLRAVFRFSTLALVQPAVCLSLGCCATHSPGRRVPCCTGGVEVLAIANCYPIDEHFVYTITSRCRMTRHASSQPPLLAGPLVAEPHGPLRNGGFYQTDGLAYTNTTSGDDIDLGAGCVCFAIFNEHGFVFDAASRKG